MNSDLVILEIGSNEYECSKDELSKCSEYFHIMFTDDFAEKKKLRIQLNNVTVTSWEHIRHFMENGLIKVDLENENFLDDMLELLQTVNMFRFTDIEERCSDIISNAVETRNCLKIWDIAGRIESKVLIRKAKAFALWHFDDVAQLNAFNELKLHQIEGYCGDAALHCSAGEWGVWMAIDRWMNFSEDSPSRRQHTSRLLLCLRPHGLTWEDLSKILMNESIKACPLAVKAIETIMKERKESGSLKESSPDYKRLKKSDESEKSEEVVSYVEKWLKVRPRKVPKVPCIVGNVFTGSDTTSPYIIKYCEKENKFMPLIWLQKMETGAGTMMGYKVVSDGFKMYLVGGLIMNRQNLWNDSVWTYDPLSNSWSFFARVYTPIRHMSVCILGNELYIIGGIGRHRVIQNQVSKLCLNNRVWSDCASVPQNLYSTPSVVFRGCIYLVDCHVYEYNPKTNVWRTVTDKAFAIGFSCAVADNEYIYLAGSCTNVIYKLNPAEARQELEILGHFKHECTQACLIDGFIYSLSQDEHADDIFCEKMNVTTGETVLLYEGKTDSVIADITPRHRHGCFSVFTY